MSGSTSSGDYSRPSRRTLILAVLGALAVAAIAVWLWSAPNSADVLAWKRGANPFVFFVGMALLTMVGFPATPFYVLAGATFGVWIGLAGSGAALAVNLLLSFWIARSRLRPALERVLQRTRFSLPDLQETPDRALRFTTLTKLAPGVPTFVKHYLIALAGVPFATYFLVSFTISGLYAAALIVLGESLLQHELGKVVGASAILLALGVAIVWWQRRRAKTTSTVVRESDASLPRRDIVIEA